MTIAWNLQGLTALLPWTLRFFQLTACVAAGVFIAYIGAPSPGNIPPALASAANQHVSTRPVSAWFGEGLDKAVNISVQGLIADAGGGSAILVVNNRPPRAYFVGQTLADGVTLTAIRATGVVVDLSGRSQDIPMQVLPQSNGIRSADR
ncbi:MAG: hypothetical protein WCY07_08995 [Pigmentiphaga sp.]